MICECFESCPFYNDKMSIESALGKMYKANYCEGNKESCARYMVVRALGREHVPLSLYPNMQEAARRIIAAKLKTKSEG
ncbi:MAG: hypothetical protein ACOX5M_01630 [Bacillota bacterium]|jgi:hypothetical protein